MTDKRKKLLIKAAASSGLTIITFVIMILLLTRSGTYQMIGGVVLFTGFFSLTLWYTSRILKMREEDDA